MFSIFIPEDWKVVIMQATLNLTRSTGNIRLAAHDVQCAALVKPTNMIIKKKTEKM
jgi:hypothetical protein